MKTKNLNIIIVLGLVATIGILVAQLLWTKDSFNQEKIAKEASVSYVLKK